MGGSKEVKIRKSYCKNEYGSILNLEFSFFNFVGGYLFCQRFPELQPAIRDGLPAAFYFLWINRQGLFVLLENQHIPLGVCQWKIYCP